MKSSTWNTEQPRETPTSDAIRRASTYLQDLKTPRKKFIVLATDGEPTCIGAKTDPLKGNADALKDTVAALQEAVKAGIPVFVVGVATATSATANAALNEMAMAGGRARMGDPRYYAATLKSELVSSLDDITQQVASCSLPLDMPPPSPDDVAVKVDGTRIARGTADGWSYGANMRAVELAGMACTNLKASKDSKLEILFGCPGVVIP